MKNGPTDRKTNGPTNEKVTSAPIEALEVKLNAHYYRPTGRPMDQTMNQRTEQQTDYEGL